MMRGTRIIFTAVAALPYCLLSHGHGERDKNNADGVNSSALLILVARA